MSVQYPTRDGYRETRDTVFLVYRRPVLVNGVRVESIAGVYDSESEAVDYARVIGGGSVARVVECVRLPEVKVR